MIDAEFAAVCREIADMRFSEQEWAKHESCDWFQTANYSGGFDADEGAFCFSYYDTERTEWWFSLTLKEVYAIAAGEDVTIVLQPIDA